VLLVYVLEVLKIHYLQVVHLIQQFLFVVVLLLVDLLVVVAVNLAVI